MRNWDEGACWRAWQTAPALFGNIRITTGPALWRYSVTYRRQWAGRWQWRLQSCCSHDRRTGRCQSQRRPSALDDVQSRRLTTTTSEQNRRVLSTLSPLMDYNNGTRVTNRHSESWYCFQCVCLVGLSVCVLTPSQTVVLETCRHVWCVRVQQLLMTLTNST